jgi:hypothetical protein
MNRAHVLGTVLVVGSPPIASNALAAESSDAGAAGNDEVKALDEQLDDELRALSLSDCELACRALGSIRRAADRICALEPGPRCDAARAKANDTTRRVEDACPSCAAAARTEAGRAPPGGCRSCSAMGAGSAPDLGLLLLGVFGIARAVVHRRRRG